MYLKLIFVLGAKIIWFIFKYLLPLRKKKERQALYRKRLFFALKMTPEPFFIIYQFMKYQTYDELKGFASGKLEIENPCLKPNAKNIGIWLKKNGYVKVRI